MSPEGISERINVSMEDFRAEIAQLVNKRKVPLESTMNLNNLSETDVRMWNIIKNYKKGSISRQELSDYKKETHASGNPDRKIFADTIISNTLALIWLKEELEEIK